MITKNNEGMKKIKLFYTQNGQLLWSQWPEVPEVQASIYKEGIVMSKYNKEFDWAMRHSVLVENTDKAISKINQPMEVGKVYELECDYIVKSNAAGHHIEIK